MQFTTIFVTAALSTLAAATKTVIVAPPSSTPIPASQCNVSDLQCCNSTQQASSTLLGPILGLLNIVIQPITAIVGVNCSPINVLGIGSGGACTAQPVCCQNNTFNGLIAVGCTPINLGL